MVEKFIEGVTPSNYFLTKSMEITKLETSGTLWYLKKFLVLYESVFLSKSIRTKDGVNSVIKIFEDYIKSLPESQQKDAESFFFPKNIDIRKKYKTYREFIGMVEFGNKNEENKYFALVDKYYFVYLMNIGGQSGVKAFIRENIYSENFSVRDLKEIIKEYDRIHGTRTNAGLIISDYPAALRNERQILFYYGFVHSRTNGAKSENEFSSLTPIGELALRANSKEFSILWEHQKIKMISQPVTVELPSISGCNLCDGEKFQLNFKPYFTILSCLYKNKSINNEFYDYVLSRTNNNNYEEVIDNYITFYDNVDKIKENIKKFNIKSDIVGEDFDKEIKKYMLGIRNDLYKDHSSNYMAFCKFVRGIGWVVDDNNKLNKIIRIYSQIENYKYKNYKNLYIECENELRKKYIASYTEDHSYKLNNKIKINWDLYNIHRDKIIMSSLIIMNYSLFENLELEEIKIEKLAEYTKLNFDNILKSINITSKKDIKKLFKEILDLISNESLENLEIENEYSLGINIVNEYIEIDSSDLLNKIKTVSDENVNVSLERKRDSRIINLLNNYYLANYLDENNLIKCECCGNVTFPKQNNEPYIEFHHLIPFSIADGPDHYENIFGICPMCHRKIHNGSDVIKSQLYDNFDENNHFKKSILDRFKDLYSKKILKSYQLEYALSEQIINESEYEQILA